MARTPFFSDSDSDPNSNLPATFGTRDVAVPVQTEESSSDLSILTIEAFESFSESISEALTPDEDQQESFPNSLGNYSADSFFDRLSSLLSSLFHKDSAYSEESQNPEEVLPENTSTSGDEDNNSPTFGESDQWGVLYGLFGGNGSFWDFIDEKVLKSPDLNKVDSPSEETVKSDSVSAETGAETEVFSVPEEMVEVEEAPFQTFEDINQNALTLPPPETLALPTSDQLYLTPPETLALPSPDLNKVDTSDTEVSPISEETKEVEVGEVSFQTFEGANQNALALPPPETLTLPTTDQIYLPSPDQFFLPPQDSGVSDGVEWVVEDTVADSEAYTDPEVELQHNVNEGMEDLLEEPDQAPFGDFISDILTGDEKAKKGGLGSFLRIDPITAAAIIAISVAVTSISPAINDLGESVLKIVNFLTGAFWTEVKPLVSSLSTFVSTGLNQATLALDKIGTFLNGEISKFMEDPIHYIQTAIMNALVTLPMTLVTALSTFGDYLLMRLANWWDTVSLGPFKSALKPEAAEANRKSREEAFFTNMDNNLDFLDKVTAHVNERTAAVAETAVDVKTPPTSGSVSSSKIEHANDTSSSKVGSTTTTTNNVTNNNVVVPATPYAKTTSGAF